MLEKTDMVWYSLVYETGGDGYEKNGFVGIAAFGGMAGWMRIAKGAGSSGSGGAGSAIMVGGCPALVLKPPRG
ncbi:hypothetical protein AGMMS49942_02330 [Spirochaetia bacterium]|nr:hypothetical protein AGMMS49942_02330 [Spirochaetia bacterium]